MKIYLASIMAITLNISGCSVLDDMKHMKKSTDHVANSTDSMAQQTDAMAANTKSMESATQTMAARTNTMAETTQAMAQTTRELAALTSGMSTTIQGMAETTQRMAETTQGMAKTTQQLKSATDDLYHDLRQGNALLIRARALELMTSSEDQIAKIGYASQYFMAFEFQVWKANSDSAQSLETLRRDACDEFLRTLQNYLPKNRSEISPNHAEATWKSLYALSAALHILNSNTQGEGPASTGGMLELLRKGLAAKSLVDSGVIAIGDLPEYQRKVLDFSDDVALLLNIRANFIASMVINQIGVRSQLLPNGLPGADEQHPYLWTTEKLRGVVGPWTGRLEQRNVGELTVYVELMDRVATTRQILRDAGAVVVTDSLLSKVAGHLVLEDPTSMVGLSAAKMAAMTKLTQALDSWRLHNDWRTPLSIDEVAGAAAVHADYVAVVDLYTDALFQGKVRTLALKAQEVADLSTLGLGRRVSSTNVRYLKPQLSLRFAKSTRAELLSSGASYVASASGHDANVGLSHQSFNDAIQMIQVEQATTTP